MTTTAWRKASGCHHNGTCLEVAAVWRKAEGSAAKNCVELATLGGIAVRDSKNPHNPHLHFNRREFTTFANALKAAA